MSFLQLTDAGWIEDVSAHHQILQASKDFAKHFDVLIKEPNGQP